MVEIDVRGFSCPVPVVRTKKAMELSPKEVLNVLVQDNVAKENITRLAQSNGYTIAEAEVGDGYCLTLTPR